MLEMGGPDIGHKRLDVNNRVIRCRWQRDWTKKTEGLGDHNKGLLSSGV
jgi:hypothetical protein